MHSTLIILSLLLPLIYSNYCEGPHTPCRVNQEDICLCKKATQGYCGGKVVDVVGVSMTVSWLRRQCLQILEMKRNLLLSRSARERTTIWRVAQNEVRVRSTSICCMCFKSCALKATCLPPMRVKNYTSPDQAKLHLVCGALWPKS